MGWGTRWIAVGTIQFFFNDTATTESDTLSILAGLPISGVAMAARTAGARTLIAGARTQAPGARIPSAGATTQTVGSTTKIAGAPTARAATRTGEGGARGAAGWTAKVPKGAGTYTYTTRDRTT